MKQYGFNKATEFSKKQIGVIFANVKQGKLKAEKWYMSRMYDLADYYGYDDNRSVEAEERAIKSILKAVFDGDLDAAQDRIDKEQDHIFNLLTEKAQKSIDRDLMA